MAAGGGLKEICDKNMDDRIKICRDNVNHTYNFYCRLTAKPRNTSYVSNKYY
jgi:hypothetical protein